MRKTVQALLIFLLPVKMFAQQDTLVTEKPVTISIYTKQGNKLTGILAGRSGEELLLYPGTWKEKKNNTAYQLVRIHYSSINTIKTKRPNGFVKGLLIGGTVGAAPLLFGEGGAYVAVASLPTGLLTGGIIGASSKKKYTINGEYPAFLAFTNKFILL
jgi:hypothetical protein